MAPAVGIRDPLGTCSSRINICPLVPLWELSQFFYCYAKVSGGGGGEPEKKANALSVGKFKRLNLAKKRDILEKVCKVSYLNNLTPEGPYGLMEKHVSC